MTWMAGGGPDSVGVLLPETVKEGVTGVAMPDWSSDMKRTRWR